MELQELQQDLQDDFSPYIYIRLYLNADSIDIQTFTKLIGIKPTETSVGEGEFDYWRYESEKMYIDDINRVISPLLTKLNKNSENIVKYLSTLSRDIFGMCVNICVYDEPFKINISRENIEILAKVNCMLQFDVM